MYNKFSTTSTQQNENMAAIGIRPIRAHHSSHMHASFLYGIELCCIRCKKLVQEKSCTRNHVRRSSFLCKSTCTSRLVQVSWLCVTAISSWAGSELVPSILRTINHVSSIVCRYLSDFYFTLVPNCTAWWQRHTCANNLPRVVAWKRRDRDLNPQPVDGKLDA